MIREKLLYQWLGRQPYEPVWRKLSAHAGAVAGGLDKEIIFACEHEAVYTTGRRGVDNRVGSTLAAPVVHSDRGGEMTFHGPGQIMFYPIINLRSREIGIKQYVHLLEESCIRLLAEHGIEAWRKCGFPGVWARDGKIAALGVRVSRGVAFHGMALNVDVDRKWFAAINPCGLQLGIANVTDFTESPLLSEMAERWQAIFQALLHANHVSGGCPK
ncbi:lipoyl(octanoyl) transferase [Mariprofundus ferrinatatus]|uniref:Octanoyltransferase n=1 Tax=Mariprofundus ferrinatatus TaxID=1921087 RepID=A0A2K8L6S1_9PROT|nr:lipoyl(octanoyl) transferase LipB [Mariprofundus ferrinatatus]ATX81541.1 lipoyl(octanoyl) transferase [Mariprofundus ferrinatatus]